MSEWKPIETAPRDGTSVLCFAPIYGMPGRIIVLRFDINAANTWRADVHSFVEFEPTHWMPLPEPPTGD